MPLHRYLQELSDDGRPLVMARLVNLSDMPAEELHLFREAWAGMSPQRRREISASLVTLAEENANLNFDDIFLACLHDPDETVRVSSIDGLWEYEKRALIEPMIALLRGDRKESVRAAAAMALRKFTMLAELGKIRPDDAAKVERALFAAIEDGEEQNEVRRRAVEAVAPLSQPYVKQIIQRAYHSEDVTMRVSAVYAMGINSDPAWLPTLLHELDSAEAEMRFEASNACGELGEEEAVLHLIRLVHDMDTQVQLSAIAALGKIGGNEAEAALHGLLGHADEHIRDAAQDAVEELKREEDPFTFGVE